MSIATDKGGFEWTDEHVATLRDLWDHGLRDAEIGAEIGTSARAVACKRHRLGLRRYKRDTRPIPADAAKRLEAARDALEIVYSMAKAGHSASSIAETIREVLATL